MVNVIVHGHEPSLSEMIVAASQDPEIIEYLEATLKKVSEDAEFKKTMTSIGQPVDYLNTKDWAAFMQRASKDYGDLIKELDIKL